MNRVVQIIVLIFCIGFTFTGSKCQSPIQESHYLIRVQVYGQFSEKIGPKTSLLIMTDLNNLHSNSDSIFSIKDKSGLRSQIVYYLQASNADVIDFNPEHSVRHGCCYFGDAGYIDPKDSLVNSASDPYIFDEYKFRNFEICRPPNRVIISMCKINATVARCKEIRSQSQEINYSDSITYLCEIRATQAVNNDEFQLLSKEFEKLSTVCK